VTTSRSWTVRLTAAAEIDFQNIIAWTLEHFGPDQAHVYADTLSAALEALAEGPTVVGARERHDILPGLMTLHVARQGRKGRHFVLFRAAAEAASPRIEVLRVLHDAMDLARHVP
jgi:toxin ParE1/3/4